MNTPNRRAIRVDRLPGETHVGILDRRANAGPNAATSSPIAACLEIRRVVFTEGQGVSFEEEFDGLDDQAEHFLAWRVDSNEPVPIGTARLRVSDAGAKAERVAVLEAERRSGAGRALMLAIESRARELGLEQIVLNAQVAVIPFYEKLGYVAHGDVFVEADIDHRAMTKRLTRES